MKIKCNKVLDLTNCICTNNIKTKYMLENEEANFNKIIKEDDIIGKSSNRRKVICPVFYNCGGCDFLYINYNHQIELKLKYVNYLFYKFSLNFKIKNIIKSNNEYYYRHKVINSAVNVNNKLKLGLYQEQSKKVTPFLDCFIQDKECNEILKKIELILNKYSIKAFDGFNGIIKHVLIRKSSLNQFLVVFVTNSKLFPNNKKIVNDLIKVYPNIKSIVQNINDRKTSLVLLDKEIILYGKGYIEEKIEDLIFNLSSKSFFQINYEMMNKLYAQAIKLSAINKNEIVMDCYSGVGSISLLLSKYAKEVIAIEINKQAHIDALNNKKRNKINNITFVNEDVSRFLKTYRGKIDCLFMDPTRDGSDKNFLDSLLYLKPNKVIYISCGQETLARDLNYLSKSYEIKDVYLFDMFPNTKNIESVTLLKLKK